MAITTDEVKKLAELARLALTDEEVTKMQREVESILSYVGTIQKIDLAASDDPSPHLTLTNVMREDTEPEAGNTYTEDLLAAAPQRDGRFIKVKKILG